MRALGAAVIGLIYLIAFVGALTFAIGSFAPARARLISGLMQWLLLFLLAPVLALSAFVLGAVVFYGQQIYVFNLHFAVLLISGVALVGCALALSKRWPLIANASRLGTAYLVPFIFVVLEPLRKWLQISTSY